MEQIFLTAAVLLLPMLCTTAGAAGVFLLRKTGEPATRRMLCGMAAGIMLAASVWSLLLPAIERAEQGPLPAWVPPAVGLLLGAVGLLRLETLAGRLLNAGPGRSGRMVLAVTLHNIPEGIAVAIPIYYATRSKSKAFWHSLLSGLAEPVGAIAGYFLLAFLFTDSFVGVILAGVAGIMVYISLDELLPTAEKYGEHHPAILGVIAGMAVMGVSLILI